MNRVVYYLRLWKGYQRRGFLEMTQYPTDTVIMIISLLLREAAGFIGILAIAYAAGGLGGSTLSGSGQHGYLCGDDDIFYGTAGDWV